MLFSHLLPNPHPLNGAEKAWALKKAGIVKSWHFSPLLGLWVHNVMDYSYVRGHLSIMDLWEHYMGQFPPVAAALHHCQHCSKICQKFTLKRPINQKCICCAKADKKSHMPEFLHANYSIFSGTLVNCSWNENPNRKNQKRTDFCEWNWWQEVVV